MADINWKAVHKQEARDFVRDFYQTSWNWRSQAYHSRWDKWENNYNSIYDPNIKAKKESWQCTMFDPMTFTNVEVIAAAITKILFGRKRPIGLEPREMGDELQAELNTCLLEYQLDRSDYSVHFHDVFKQSLKFGSGFGKFWWDRKMDKRRIMTPRMEDVISMMRNMRSQPALTGYDEQVKEVLVKNQVRFEMVPIRDIFLAPNTMDMARVLHRNSINYGELVQYSKMKGPKGDFYFDPDSVEALKGARESQIFSIEERSTKSQQGLTDPEVPAPIYAQPRTVFEYWGEIPRKWINLEMSDTADGADELVGGKIMTASKNYFLCSEENPMPDMLPPFLQADYINCGQTYGIGVGQILEGLQEEINEIRNQRVDNVNLVMNKIFIALEKFLVDPKELISRPGQVIRLKGSAVDDVRKVVAEVPVSEVAFSAYKETGELERKAQEATAANRVTIGTPGATRDSNQTLGGMELLKGSAAERFTMYAYRIGRTFLIHSAKKYMQLIYQNMTPEEIKRVLGQEPVTMLGPDGKDEAVAKYLLYKKSPPHEIEMDYDYMPFDVFTEENKYAKAQMLMSFGQFLATVLPQWNPKNLAKRIGYYQGIPPEELTEILGDLNQPIPTPLTMGQGMPSISKASKPTLNQSPTQPAMNGAPL